MYCYEARRELIQLRRRPHALSAGVRLAGGSTPEVNSASRARAGDDRGRSSLAKKSSPAMIAVSCSPASSRGHVGFPTPLRPSMATTDGRDAPLAFVAIA